MPRLYLIQDQLRYSLHAFPSCRPHSGPFNVFRMGILRLSAQTTLGLADKEIADGFGSY
jgi:hypothetical protein